ncbi:MAG TPA: GNAT family N-acetyltransferase [Dehalococcoidia bacterium]
MTVQPATETPHQRVSVRRAGPEDVETVAEILEDAAAWILARGIRQWPARFPRSFVSSAIRDHEVYLVLDGEAAVGTVTIQWSDEPVWGPQPGDAGYVHRLAVRRDRAGQGLGRWILSWAEERVRAAGRRYLRLDCMAANAGLRRYYEAAGFASRGEVTVGTWRAARYERDLRPAP